MEGDVLDAYQALLATQRNMKYRKVTPSQRKEFLSVAKDQYESAMRLHSEHAADCPLCQGR
jgi:hypothetical protein